MKLYYSPGACSLAVHIALEEAELDYSLQLVKVSEGEQLRPEFLRLNPFGRVPVLQFEDGSHMTEVAAQLLYIASVVPARGLMPERGRELIEAVQWMGMFASEVHPPFGVAFRPTRLSEEESVQSEIRKGGLGRFWETLQLVDKQLAGRHAVLSTGSSLVDAYALVFYLWAARGGFPVAELKNYSRLVRAVIRRPASRRALQQEALQEPVEALLGSLARPDA